MMNVDEEPVPVRAMWVALMNGGPANVAEFLKSNSACDVKAAMLTLRDDARKLSIDMRTKGQAVPAARISKLVDDISAYIGED